MAGKKWSEDAKKRWAEKQRKLHAAVKARLDAGGHGGAGDGGADGAGAGGAGVDGQGGGGEGASGWDLLGATPGKAPENKSGATSEELPALDLAAIKPALPGYLIEYNELLDDVVQGITSGKMFRKLWFIKALSPEKAKAEAEFLWQIFVRIVPAFVKNHPVLAGAGVIIFKPIMRLRSKEKPKEEVNAQNPAEKEKSAGAQ